MCAPILTAIIVSYNTRDLTLRCLADLYADLGDTSAEVFLVDNGSADGSVAAVRGACPEVIVIEVGHNAGFAAANNLAMTRATGEFVLLLNTDAFVKLGAIRVMMGYLREHPRTAVVGPRLLNADGSLQPSCYKFPNPARALCEHTLLTAAFPNHRLLGDYRTWPHDVEREVEFVIGACMMVRRSAIDEVGMFDENFFMYSEETDWCRRFRNAGWAVAFVPGAEVVHLNGGSGKQQGERVFNEFGRGAERYIRKHHGWVGLQTFRVCMIGGASIRIALFGVKAMLPGSRTRARGLVRKWIRILAWNLGRRGPGLKRDAGQGGTGVPHVI